MEKPKHHLFVCASFRTKGEPKGVCHKSSIGLLPYIDEEILDRNLDVLVTSTGCLKQCENGPVMVVYPEGWWFGKVDSEDAVDAVLDGLEEGRPAEEYLL